MRAMVLFFSTSFLFFIALTAGCAGSTSYSNTQSGADPRDVSFENILVVAIADNYSGRAQYERAVASGLRRNGVSATPYHEAVGGNEQISSERARELIAANGFDAVLVTSVRDSATEVDVQQDSAATKVTRRDDRPVDFFRYQYEDLDEPGEINILAKATLDTDLYNASDEAPVWSFRWTSKGAENVGLLIDESSGAVVRRLNRDGFIGN